MIPPLSKNEQWYSPIESMALALALTTEGYIHSAIHIAELIIYMYNYNESSKTQLNHSARMLADEIVQHLFYFFRSTDWLHYRKPALSAICSALFTQPFSIKPEYQYSMNPS